MGLRSPILCLWMAVGLAVVSCESCSRMDQLSCTKKLDSYFTNTHNVYPNFDDDTFDKVCSTAESADTCLSKLEPWCSSIDQRHHEGQRTAYVYICGQGSIVYKESRDCLDDADLLKDAAKCYSTYQEDLQELADKAYYMDMEDMAKEQCRLTNIYLWCVRGAVKGHCGGVSAQWQHKVNRLVLTPVLDEINCVIDEPFPVNRVQILIIVISIAVAVVFVIMIILTIIFCIQRKREKDALLAQEVQAEEEDDDAKKHPLEFDNQAMMGSKISNGSESREKPHILSSIPPPRDAKVAPVQNGNQKKSTGQGENHQQRHHAKAKKHHKKRQHHDHSGSSHDQHHEPRGHHYSQHPHPHPHPHPQPHPHHPHPQPQYLVVPDPNRSLQYSTEGSLKSSMRGSTARSNRSARSVTMDETANRSLPEYDIVPQKY